MLCLNPRLCNVRRARFAFGDEEAGSRRIDARYDSRMRILVLGGYGNFGARICRALAQGAQAGVVAGGRNPQAAPADFAHRGIRTAAVDIASPRLVDALAAIGCDVVIHCAGPFQGQDYAVARHALAAGAHYIDLADGRDFVAGFPAALDGDARKAGRVAISGASTLPALSAAVVDALAGRLRTLKEIHTVIAPAQRAPRGAATIAGVMSYAGRPFDMLVGGAWTRHDGWGHVRRLESGPLGRRLSAVCDVPDLALFPQRYAGVETVTFRAALELGIQHRAIAALAALRRGGVAIPITGLIGMIESAARLFDHFGSSTGTGGMEVTVSGTSDTGAPLRLRWRVMAPDHHGPEIPCMPAILLARRLAAAADLGAGAHACMGFVQLADFAPEFDKWGMTTEVEEFAA